MLCLHHCCCLLKVSIKVFNSLRSQWPLPRGADSCPEIPASSPALRDFAPRMLNLDLLGDCGKGLLGSKLSESRRKLMSCPNCLQMLADQSVLACATQSRTLPQLSEKVRVANKAGWIGLDGTRVCMCHEESTVNSRRSSSRFRSFAMRSSI